MIIRRNIFIYQTNQMLDTDFDADEARKDRLSDSAKAAAFFRSIPQEKFQQKIKDSIEWDQEFAEQCQIEKVRDWELSRGV